MLTQEHVQVSLQFLDDADREFAAGDALQGSEKLWGAASQAVKALGHQRGWDVGSHRDMKNAVIRLAGERDDLSLRAAFATAEKFHANFYSGFMEEYEFGPDGEIVRDFVDRVLNGYIER